MPNWLLIIVTLTVSLSIIVGIIGFPYVAMIFNVNENHSPLTKLIVGLLVAFPLVAGFCLYYSWTSNPLAALIPLAYILSLWIIKPKDHYVDESYFYTKEENLQALQDQISLKKSSWLNITKSRFFYGHFISTNEQNLLMIEKNIKAIYSLALPTEYSSYSDGRFTIGVHINLPSYEINGIERTVVEFTEIAWKNNSYFDAMDILEK